MTEQSYEYSSWYDWWYDLPTEIPADQKQVRLRHILHAQIRSSKNIKRKLKRTKPTLKEFLASKKTRLTYKDVLVENNPKKVFQTFKVPGTD